MKKLVMGYEIEEDDDEDEDLEGQIRKIKKKINPAPPSKTFGLPQSQLKLKFGKV